MSEVITLAGFPADKLFIQLHESMREKLIDKSLRTLKIKSLFELSRWINRVAKDRYRIKVKFNGGDIGRWLSGECFDSRVDMYYPKFMPLWVILELAKLNNISISALQENILSYRSGGRGKIINLPKLPILVTPELESIIVHLFGDGYVGNGTPSYYQKRKEGRANFINKLKNCFGDFVETTNESKWQVRFPKAITDILSKYYSIDSYLSKKCKIPLRVINRKDKHYKLACIIAFIFDEGNIRDVISMYSVNYRLISQIRDLAKQCGYACRGIKLHKSAGTYYFSIQNKDIKNLLKDIERLCEEFPTCNLGHKHELLVNLVRQQAYSTPKNYELTDNRILECLKKRPCTSKEIAFEMKCIYGTVQAHLRKLYVIGKVQKQEINKICIWNLC